MKLRHILFCLVLACGHSHAQSLEFSSDRSVDTIFFGSCIKQNKPMPLLAEIARQPADMFIFLGDNIYADTEDPKVMKAKYEKLGADAGFKQLKSAMPVLATWDDHDFGVNDGGASYAMKEKAQQLFLDFWADPPTSPRRKRKGVYAAYRFGPADRRVQIILLDTRYFRGKLEKGEKRRTGGPYIPTKDPSVTMLGEQQWAWLEKQLLEPARIRIIGSSIQLIAEASGQETWSNIPLERERLFRLIKKTKANGVLVLSGDRHWSEISRTKEAGYPLYDVTSSSINQPHGRGTPTANKFRASSTTWHRENYGRLHIDWKQKDPQITAQIIGLGGVVRIEQKVQLSKLRSE